MSLSQVLQDNNNDLSDHDLAHLSDWASGWHKLTPNKDWKRAFSLIREGSDLLLRRRAMSRAEGEKNHIGAPPASELEAQFKVCPSCKSPILSEPWFVYVDPSTFPNVTFTSNNSRRCTHEWHGTGGVDLETHEAKTEGCGPKGRFKVGTQSSTKTRD